MNANELKAHLQDKMRNGLADHLREHGITDVPTKRTEQIKLHAAQDHGVVQDAASAADASVLKGLTRPAGSKPAVNEPKPRPATRTAAKAAASKPAAGKPAASKPATASKPASRTSKPAASKPAAGKPASKQEQPAAASNGASPRDHNQELARRLADMVAKEFADSPVADQVKVANWLHALPTGGAGWQRYWPAGFARPTSAGWRVPDGESLPQ